MKSFVVSCLVVAVVVAAALAAPAEESSFYSSKYDNFDADSLVQNNRLLHSYCNCFLDKGPCTAEGKDIKGVLPEAIATTCGKCSPKQRQLVRKVMSAMKDKTDDDCWKNMVAAFDPKGEHSDTLEKFLVSED